MAKDTSAAKKSKRSNKGVIKQARGRKESGRVTPHVTSACERGYGGPQVSAIDSVPSLAERVQAEREQIFKALAIVECCKYASATLYEVSDSEYMVPVFEVVRILLDSSADELGRIADECKRL